MSEVNFAEAWAELERTTETHTKPRHAYKHYRPLTDAANLIVAEAQDDHRIFLGIPEFDQEMRGIGRGHLCNIVGFSHSGKTLVLLKILENNPTKRIAYFAPDETQALVLTKVTSITHGVGARELESQVAKGDRAAIDLLRSTATEKYPNLAVFDGTLTPRTMSEGLAEAEEVWGEKVDLIIIDYVDLFEHGESVPQKFNWLKAFGIDHYVPMIAIHQASRSSGSNGKEMDIDSGGYGGEQQATFLIGVRRKEAELRAKLQNERQKAAPDADKITLLLRELDIAQHTLTANLVKNKRPGGRRVGEIDFEIEAGTGHLRQLDDGELPRQWLASRPDIAAPTVATPVWQEQEIEYEEPF